jgi:hypothetical protein
VKDKQLLGDQTTQGYFPDEESSDEDDTVIMTKTDWC